MSLILIVEKDAAFADRIATTLRAEGHTIDAVANCEAALQHAAAQAPHFVLVSGALPGAQDLLHRMSKASGGPGSVVLVPAQMAGQLSAEQFKADHLLPKPFPEPELLALVNAGVHTKPAQKDAPAPPSDQLTSEEIFGDVLAEVEAEAQKRGAEWHPSAASPQLPSAAPRANSPAKPASSIDVPSIVKPKPKRRRTSESDIDRQLEQTLSGFFPEKLKRSAEAGSKAADRATAGTPKRKRSTMPSADEIDDLLDKTLSSLELPKRTKRARSKTTPSINSAPPSPNTPAPAIKHPDSSLVDPIPSPAMTMRIPTPLRAEPLAEPVVTPEAPPASPVATEPEVSPPSKPVSDILSTSPSFAGTDAGVTEAFSLPEGFDLPEVNIAQDSTREIAQDSAREADLAEARRAADSLADDSLAKIDSLPEIAQADGWSVSGFKSDEPAAGSSAPAGDSSFFPSSFDTGAPAAEAAPSNAAFDFDPSSYPSSFLPEDNVPVPREPLLPPPSSFGSTAPVEPSHPSSFDSHEMAHPTSFATEDSADDQEVAAEEPGSPESTLDHLLQIRDSSPPSTEASGIPFGDYRLLERVAVGGMAEVWRARRRGVEGFQKTVAIKKILSHLTGSTDFVTMFIDEAKLAAQLSHANIIQIYDLGKVDGDFYIAMEFVDGKDLRTIENRAKELGKPIPIGIALVIIASLARALDYAHRKRDFENRALGLVHRDVSPQNVLISHEGDIKLCDFGIVKAVAKTSTTQMGALKGKLQYMSPEQAWGKEVDARSDIFSLGAVLFEVLVGRRLFTGDSEIGVLDAVRDCRVESPRKLNAEVPPEVDAIVLKALTASADDRYQTAGDLADDIAKVLESMKPAIGQATLASFMVELFGHELDERSSFVPSTALQTPSASAASLSAERPSSERLSAERPSSDSWSSQASSLEAADSSAAFAHSLAESSAVAAGTLIPGTAAEAISSEPETTEAIAAPPDDTAYEDASSSPKKWLIAAIVLLLLGALAWVLYSQLGGISTGNSDSPQAPSATAPATAPATQSPRVTVTPTPAPPIDGTAAQADTPAEDPSATPEEGEAKPEDRFKTLVDEALASKNEELKAVYEAERKALEEQLARAKREAEGGDG